MDLISRLLGDESLLYEEGSASGYHCCNLQVEAVAIEVEDWVAGSPLHIPRPAFPGNAGLQSLRTAHNHTDINVAPLLRYQSEDFCTSKEKELAEPRLRLEVIA